MERTISEPEEQRLELGHLGADGVVHEVDGVLISLDAPKGLFVSRVLLGIRGLELVHVDRVRSLRVQTGKPGAAGSGSSLPGGCFGAHGFSVSGVFVFPVGFTSRAARVVLWHKHERIFACVKEMPHTTASAAR